MKKNLVAIFALVFATSALCTPKDLQKRVTLRMRVLALTERISAAEQERTAMLQLGRRRKFSEIVKYVETLYNKKQLLEQRLQHNS